MPTSAEFRSKLLRRAKSDKEFALYRAALEWDLVDPIVIESADDFRSTPRWTERLEPFRHQVENLITFCRRLPVTLLADDVGLGKTISAGLVVSELMARARVAKVLVIAPKSLGPQWVNEFASKFDIPAEVAIGRELLEAEPERGAVVTTYNSARLYLEKLPEDRFQMLILDEAHKLRNRFGTDSPPSTAMVIDKALQERRFRFVLMLTATPIQNRLWDLYSLVHLLSVARGHQNPFGNERNFAAKFISDSRDRARQLRPDAKDAFQAIVYSYMSRVRRGDAQLYFPDRKVQLHRVEPTPLELELIRAIAKPIQSLNKLAQISILQALTSSPQALQVQLRNMAKNGTVPVPLFDTVTGIVEQMTTSAKLAGLENLVDGLRRTNPDGWRVIIFTGRKETQRVIENFLRQKGITVGIINGDSPDESQAAIKGLWKNPPTVRAIVSTEAGAEGLNMQVANVLVNYDLPWNPMIVEQRIGRVQRLASEHAHVTICNITLRGTFEDYIVGRLMEKLQMASHAIGDIEALLQGADISDEDEDAGKSFEDKILELVLAAIRGRDVTRHTELAAQSIDDARRMLEEQEDAINDMIGKSDGPGYTGPKTPTLPPPQRSTSIKDLTLGTLDLEGATVSEPVRDLYLVERKTGREHIRFTEHAASNQRSTLYDEGSPAFQRLVTNAIASAVHQVNDVDQDPAEGAKNAARSWISGFGGEPRFVDLQEVRRAFTGTATLRVRAGVAHDAYERLVDVECLPSQHRSEPGSQNLTPLAAVVDTPSVVGLDTAALAQEAVRDEAISEFSRFYLERRELEMEAAKGDERKQKKLQDEFSPRVEASLVGLKGSVHREVGLRVRYAFGNSPEYESSVTALPCTGALIATPPMGLCTLTGETIPETCLDTCSFTGAAAMKHLLIKSEVSGRLATPDFGVICSLSGKQAFSDEVDASDVTGNAVIRSLLVHSSVSGRRAEPNYFSRCAFTGAQLLSDEQALSEVSGKLYRLDQQQRSELSGLTGHKSEFIECAETRATMARTEAEVCELTGKHVRPGVLEVCEISGQRVLPGELGTCADSGMRVLRQYLVPSSISGRLVVRGNAVRSRAGAFCLADESVECIWSARRSHPDDIRTCALTGLPIHVEFVTQSGPPRLKMLVELLDGMTRPADHDADWERAGFMLSRAVRGAKVAIDAARTSPSGKYLAVCGETRQMLGLRTRTVGSLVALEDLSVVGRMSVGKREKSGWSPRA